jgi:hypothetical protein
MATTFRCAIRMASRAAAEPPRLRPNETVRETAYRMLKSKASHFGGRGILIGRYVINQ